MTQETIQRPAETPGEPRIVDPAADPADPGKLQSYLDFEVHVAAGQVWLGMPGHADCRAMYPEHARALANAMEQTAEGGADRTVFLDQNVSFQLHCEGPDLVMIFEDCPVGHHLHNAIETAADAARLARRVREAADRAEHARRMARMGRTAWI